MENINIIGLVETAMGALGYRTEGGGINLSRNLDILNPVCRSKSLKKLERWMFNSDNKAFLSKSGFVNK